MDPTATELVDLPPLSDEQVEEMARFEKMEPWAKVKVDDYGLVGPAALNIQVRRDLEESSAAAAVNNDESSNSGSEDLEEGASSSSVPASPLAPVEDDGSDDEGVALNSASAPMDLLDVNPASLIPKINLKRFADVKNALSILRKKLVPLHRRICPRGARFSRVCVDRRRANARILHSIVRRGCAERRGKCARVVRRCPKAKPRCTNSRAAERRSACSQGLCTPGRASLRRVSRRYLLLRNTYSRLYIRYSMLLAKFYRRKFRTLARVFIETVKRLKWEHKRVQDENKKLTAYLAKLRAESKKMRDTTSRIHADQKGKLKVQQDTHNAHLKKAAKSISEVRAELLREMSATAKLQRELDALNAKLRREESLRARHAANAAAVKAAAGSLSKANQNLLNQIGSVQAQLDNSRARTVQLRNLRDELLRRQMLLQSALEQLRADTAANDRAAARIQTSYNELLSQFNRLRDSHMSAEDAQKEMLNTLKEQIRVQAQRCVPDACGVCNGDESSCATTRSAGSCYSVGDPHFRSFDGMYFDFQIDGQFVLLKHGNPVNFEIQTMQRLAHGCPWSPRLNKGVAVRGGRNVAVMYTDWGTSVMVINGQRMAIPAGSWQRLGPGFTVYRAHDRHAVFRYENYRTRQVVTTSLEVTPWPYGAFTSVSIAAPWQWSSGRSLWGLCLNFNNWVGDDSLFLGRNWGRLFYVTNSANDMFANPGRRTVDIELVDFSEEDIAKEQQLDKLNGVRAAEDLELATEADLQAPPAAVVAPNGGAASDPNAAVSTAVNPAKLGLDGLPAKGGPTKSSVGAATPEMMAIARRRCRGSRGAVRKQCEVDVLNGLPGAAARKSFDKENILVNENLLKRCMLVNPNSFAIVPNAAVRAEEKKSEGFSYAFWYSPSSILTKRCVLLEKGANFFVTQSGADVSVGANNVTCTARAALVPSRWTAVSVSVHHSGTVKLFINSELACTASSKAGIAKNAADLFVGGADSNDTCSGRIAHLYYIPQVVTVKEAGVHGRLSPFGCHRQTTSRQATTALLEEQLEEQEDDEDADLMEDDE